MSPTSSAARSSPAALRNREPILAVLRGVLPAQGLALEIAAGSGEHSVWFARGLPGLEWRPTDRDTESLASIAAWREEAGLPNLLAPLVVDAADPAAWPVEQADAVVCINMIHISPWRCAEGLMTGAGRLLPSGGPLVLYGPYFEPGLPTAPSNTAFDLDLKRRNPDWGLRRTDDVIALAASRGLAFEARHPMPANNLTLVFRKR
jgi:hypothetical protein